MSALRTALFLGSFLLTATIWAGEDSATEKEVAYVPDVRLDEVSAGSPGTRTFAESTKIILWDEARGAKERFELRLRLRTRY
ncbi:hypothetical protein [Hydrogenivirga sp.]